ncbi:tRNA pseudouridine(55) synthase TruB [candidate division GN15 bacterium]|nr:tRNA pseudouridine(55) synthase TruB [candidate division GN15 bacterium]
MRRRRDRQADACHGILLVDKPAGMTSHDVVDRVRRAAGQRSVGHAGTLDPLATGLLVIALGKATKIVRYLTDQSKVYEAEVTLGRTSSTYDAEGIDAQMPALPVPRLSDEALTDLLAAFIGNIRQQVPAHSAVHVQGRRLYERVRAGEDVTPPEREVVIHDIEVLAYDADRLRLRVACGKGTYIRTLAHDIGQILGCGGYLSRLRRTASGRFSLEQALSLETIEQSSGGGGLAEQLVGINEALDFGSVHVDAECALGVRNGRVPYASEVKTVTGDFAEGDTVLVKNDSGQVLALGIARMGSAAVSHGDPEPVLVFDRVLQ